MTRILGIDPGQTSGWALYCTDERRVVEAGTFESHAIPVPLLEDASFKVHLTVIERPVGQGPTRPEMVDCGITFGRLYERLDAWADVDELTRLEIRQALTAAMHGTVRVINDATCKAALKALHGGEASTKKGGALYGLRGSGSHGWAALAAAVAWHLREQAEEVSDGIE